ncbi:MAG: adenylate kinase [Acidobacteria bacterium]|nr:adenylate kinase [Acidobacteriota bacterium]
MRVVLLGPPGAGKGTQAERICAAWGLPHVSTGDMLRAAIASGSALGKEVRETMDRGHLVPDELIGRIVEERLSQSDAAKGFLLDGFPRTPVQVEILERVLGARGRRLDRVVMLELPMETAIARLLLGRRDAAGKSRSDDNEMTIRERMKVYENETRPIAELYQQRRLLAKVDATGTIDEVFSRIARTLNGAEA